MFNFHVYTFDLKQFVKVWVIMFQTCNNISNGQKNGANAPFSVQS